MSLLYAFSVAFLSIIVPGFLLAYALLAKTKLHMFEITMIGFIFGLIFPPVLTWFESYFMDYIHAFTFSAGLYEVNVALLSILGLALIWMQGLLKLPKHESKLREERKETIYELRNRIRTLGVDEKLIREHEEEEEMLRRKHREELERLKDAGIEERTKIEELHKREEEELLARHEKEERLLLEGKPEKAKESNALLWTFVLVLVLFTFLTRIINIGIAPKFFEFDPYFDMLSTESILVFGYQYLHDFSAWPVLTAGSPHRIQPIAPYLEAFWYQLANIAKASATSVSTALLSYVSSFYPPITAAMLVFVVFMFLYHEYGKIPAIFGSVLVASMPVIVTTFIAGEQLLEPWGIFTLFFFYVTYALAVNNPKDLRLAVLAGVAFASTFLGAHYYTVDAGVLALYILLQGIVDLIRHGKISNDFYKMNATVLAVIAIFLALYQPYRATLEEKIPNIFGVPITLGFALYALIIVAIADLIVRYATPKLERRTSLVYAISIASVIGIAGVVAAYVKGGLRKYEKQFARYSVLVLLSFLVLVFAFATPVHKALTSYLALSKHFTSPSSPLFMTVQEFAPTGFGYDFAAGGFGIIGINAIVWFVLILFIIVSILSIVYRDSRVSLLFLAATLPLAYAAMIEVKYLPHFGAAYTIMLSMIVGEVLMLMKKRGMKLDFSNKYFTAFVIFLVLVMLAEAVPTFVNIFSGYAERNNCTAMATPPHVNSIGYDMFCNLVPNYWLNAAAWMRQNVGPYGSRILSWWDYGDWINWFGNSNAVLRGDNAVPTLDYATAARYVLGPQDGYGPANLANFSDSVQAKYVLFDNALTQKWGALDFLACVHINQTSMAFAKAAANGTNQPYVLGTSQCEIKHDPAILLLPLQATSLSAFCAPIKSLGNETLLKGIVLVGDTLTNITYCVPSNFTRYTYLYYPNGTRSNAVLVPTSQFYQGSLTISGIPYISFMLLYLPNANGTVSAPSEFYQSNYYRGFYLGRLPGFKLVYPSNFTGINYINGTYPVVIYELENFTGTLPQHTPKPSWVHNNYTMPG
jgi:asparagine N-glycosylation enzyme membrane subunit Stt3